MADDAPGSVERRFDRSSWVTLAIVITLFALSSLVVKVAHDIPSDGWLVDRGPWGRYTNPIYLRNLSGFPSDLRVGDVLLAVEGASFEDLEAQAASLNPPRPEGWDFGATVYYTVLREDQSIEVPVRLTRSPLLAPYRLSNLRWNLPVVLAPLLLFLTGSLVFLLRPRERPAQLVFLLFSANLLDDFISFNAVLPGVADLFSRVVYWPRLILGNLIWIFIIAPLVVYLFLIFPVEKWPIRRYPRLTPLLLFGLSAGIGGLYVLSSIGGRSIDVSNWQVIIFMPIIAISLVHTYFSVREPIAHQQVKWVAFGGIIGIVGSFSFWGAVGGISHSSPIWQITVWSLLFAVFPICLVMAILRYRLWDIEIIINRTLVYGTLTGLLALTYFVSAVLLERLFRALTGSASQATVVVSTLLILGLFSPLRRRVQAEIDRRFYRRKYDAQKMLTEFSATVRDEVDLQVLSQKLINIVEETMQPEQVSLWLLDSQ